MPLLSMVKWRPTVKYVTLLTIAACISVVYFNVGDIHGVPGKSAQISTFPVNVNNYQNGGQHLDAKGTSRPAIGEQEKRIAILKEYCRKNPYRGLQKYRHNLIVIDKTKTIYCYIPKTGCTTTKLVMYNLQHDTNLTSADLGPNKKVQIHQYPFKLLNKYSMEDAQMRLKTYNKLIVVRDPLERLASAWLDKFINSPGRFIFIKRLRQAVGNSKFGTTTTKRALPRNRSRQGSMAARRAPPISIRDFVWSIINNKYRNVHWEPFFSHCAPCQVQYDFIAHTDTLVEDLRLFFNMSGIVGKDGILPRQRPSRAKARFGRTFRVVPPEDIRRLGKIYKPDFDMFGYSIEEDLEMIENEQRNALKQNV
ncbi:carbohydrate sulfotransferase 11-like [Branchiostoma floridae x Branchiostoma belcheri]